MRLDHIEGLAEMQDTRGTTGGDARRSALYRQHGAPPAVGVLLADVVPEHVEWLWSGRVPRRKPVVLDGDPGLGKSTLTLELTARVTRGEPLPGDTDTRAPAGVVILSAEDGLADTIRPRLDAAGADCTRVVALPSVTVDDGAEILPAIPRDLGPLADAIARVDAALVVIDPLMAYLGAETSSYRDQDIRRALAPLAQLAETSGAAVLLVRHLRKSTADGNALYRGGGSIGIIGAARAGLLVARDPDDPDRRVLAATKCNLAREAPSLAWRLVPTPSGVARVEWLGESAHTAAALVAPPATDDDRSAADEAAYVLRTILAAGPVAADVARRQARAAGVADRTLDRARQRLGVRARREGFGAGGVWRWELAETSAASGGDAEVLR